MSYREAKVAASDRIEMSEAGCWAKICIKLAENKRSFKRYEKMRSER